MKKHSITKEILFLTLLIFGGLLAYQSVSGQSDDPFATTDSGEEVVIGRDTFVLFDKLKSYDFDGSVFQSATFQSLVDFSRSLPAESVGRSNPFAPIDSRPTSATKKPSTTAR